MKPFCLNNKLLFDRRALLFLGFIFLLSNLKAQIGFQRLYARTDTVGQSAIGGIIQTADGGYLFCGDLYQCNNCLLSDGIVIKTDANGDTSWTRIFGGAREDGFSKLVQTTDGNYVVAGGTTSWGQQATSQVYGYYVYLVKVDTQGDTLWTKIYGGTNTDLWHNNDLWDIIATPDDGLLISCMVNTSVPGSNQNVLLIKTNSKGDTLWTKLYTGLGGGATIMDIKQTGDGGYIFVGSTAPDEALVVKIDSLGIIQWQRTYGGSQTDWFSGIEIANNGDYIVSGNSSSFTSNTNVNYIYNLRLNSLGDTIWSKVYGPVFNQRFLNKINDSTYFVTGLSGTSHGGILGMKIDGLTGNILFQKEYSGTGNVNYTNITNDGGFIFGASTVDFGSGYSEGIVIKVDGNGNSGCYEYAIGENVLPAPTIVQTASLQTAYFPINIARTQTQVSRGFKIGTVCTTVGIKNNAPASFSIYPNPASEVVTLDFEQEIKGDIELVNSLGVVFYKGKTNSSKLPIPLTGFAAGIYYIKVHTAQGVLSKPFVVLH